VDGRRRGLGGRGHGTTLLGHIDTIDPLPGWEPGNPAAIYVAALRATR
jgi:hypothetical protein